MHRPAPGQHGDEVEAQGEAGVVALPGEPEVGGALDAALRVRADGVHRFGQSRARLHLDDGDEIAATGDQVDLAEPRAVADGEDAKAFQAQGPGGEKLAAVAAGEAPAAFFLSARGRRMGREELNATFIRLVRQIGLEGCGARARPRPHDLRHAFAVRTLLDWYRTGEDIDRRMPLLSTYLGHVDPASTYWYLEAVPELLQLVGERMARLPGALS